jgi:phospholipid/cholesterol/gamma-HCH transport system ATP-binding protein
MATAMDPRPLAAGGFSLAAQPASGTVTITLVKRPDTPSKKTPVPAATPGPTGVRPTEVLVEGLRKSFNDHVVLSGVDLELYRGDIIAIVGGSGCGKTVLLDHIIGQLSPDAGRVLVADHEADGATLRDLALLSDEEMDRIRMHWAVVFQRNALFSGTVYENIALWLREIKGESEDRIAETADRSLRLVGFEDPREILDRDRDELSGGMAKRVAVARAIAMDPTLVFYDEPTTGLDPQHAADIHELICATHGQKRPDRVARTTTIITHDKDLLNRLRPRVVMLHEGRVFFDGPFEEFEASDSEIIQPYFDRMPLLQQRATRGI